MTAAPRRYALIAAAGSSVRFGGGLPKQYVPIAGVPLLAHTIAALNRSIVLEAIFVVLAPGDKHYAERIGSVAGVVPVYEGGATRGESVRNGLAAIGKRAARRRLGAGARCGAALHRCDDPEPAAARARGRAGRRASRRAAVRYAQARRGRRGRARRRRPSRGTGCGARRRRRCSATRFSTTRCSGPIVAQLLDEAQAVEALGVKPRLVQGSPANIKVTYPEDIALAEAILAGRARTA